MENDEQPRQYRRLNNSRHYAPTEQQQSDISLRIEAEEEEAEREAIAEREEEFQTSGEELVSNISTVFPISSRSFGSPFISSVPQNKRCNCKPGNSCGWRTTSAHSFVFRREYKPEKAICIRLTQSESWQLSDSEISTGYYSLSTERGQGTTNIWGSTAILQGIKVEDIEPNCRNDSWWFVAPRNRSERAWLFYVKQKEDRGVSILVCYQDYEIVKEEMSVPSSLFWSEIGYSGYRRLVEYKFIHIKTFQVSSTILEWPSQLQKDIPAPLFREIFEGVPYALSRGFLRLLQ